MRWCSVFECVDEESELCHCPFGCEAQDLEHLLLKLSVVDTEASSSHFDSVAHEVVCFCPHSLRMLVEQWDIVRVRHCERMVCSHESLFLVAPFEEWEVYDPEAFELVLVFQSESVSHFES